ncbi:MAG: CU044_2847 family protein [Halobacteriota archaeon]
MEESEPLDGDAGFIQVEVVPAGAPETGLTRVGAEERVLNMCKDDFEKAMKGVADVANTVKSNLAHLNAQQVTVGFGVKLTGGVNFMVTAGLEANFNVTLTWNYHE